MNMDCSYDKNLTFEFLIWNVNFMCVGIRGVQYFILWYQSDTKYTEPVSLIQALYRWACITDTIYKLL